MSAKQHLKELQLRLMVVAGFFIVGATGAYMIQDKLIPLLLAPIGNEKLIYLNPAGGFSFIFLVSIYAGIAFAFPILIQQLYSFLRPVLPDSAQKKSIAIITGSFLLLIAGMAFGYFVAVPNALTFLYGFADQYVEASLTADSYLNFVIAYTIGIGLVFQIPLLLLLIHSIKPLKPGGLLKSERWVVLLAFVAAAIITPTPDPVNQAIIAGPVIVVYQIGVFIILFSIFRSHRHRKHSVRHAIKRAKAIQAQPRTALPAHSTTPHSYPVVHPYDATPLTTRLVTEYQIDTPEANPEPAPVQQKQAVRPVDGFSRVKRTPPQPVVERSAAAGAEKARTQTPIRTMDGVIRQSLATN